MQFRKITIVGVGLLGGSIGLAARRHRLAGEIAGFLRRAARAKDCERVAAVDYATTDLWAAVSRADLVILCTPLSQMRPLTEQFLPALQRGAIVTDVGSVKAGVVRELEPLVRRSGAHFIGSHPMAGGEKMGVLSAKADLYQGAVCVLTPTKKSNPSAVRRLEQFWRSLGARTLRLDAAQHDRLVSRSSHLPHVLAASLAGLVLDPRQPRALKRLCAAGFRDTTRIASGSPEMWRDIALANRKNLFGSLEALIAELKRFQSALRLDHGPVVERFFATAKARRDRWCLEAPATSSE